MNITPEVQDYTALLCALEKVMARVAEGDAKTTLAGEIAAVMNKLMAAAAQTKEA